jgi:hypothetical protein
MKTNQSLIESASMWFAVLSPLAGMGISFIAAGS